MKRFYKAVRAVADEDGFQIELDGRIARTPKKAKLRLPSRTLADAIALEWQAQDDRVDPVTMPLTRLANSAIDAVTTQRETVVETIAAYGGSDLVCYRADTPPDLVAAQHAHWQPLLAWIERRHGAVLTVTADITHVEQPPASLAALTAAVADFDDYGLAALHDLTTITGSLVIGLAVAGDEIDVDRAWAAAQVDEEYQAAKWGEDAEATIRRNRLKADFDHAKLFLDLLKA